MKISTKLILSFSVIILFIFVLIMMNWTIMGKVSQQSAINEQVNVLSRNIYLEETLADAYIRQAASQYFESSEIPLEPEHIARGFYRIHDNNSVLIDKLEQMLTADEEKKALSAISEKHKELKNVFEKHHLYYKNRLNKLARQKEEGVKIADLRHSLKVIVTDPAYFGAFTKNTIFYSPVSKKSEEKNILTLFRQLGYKEKEYVWQYRDKKHQDDVLAVVTELEAIVPLTSVPDSTKSNITLLLAAYKNHSINFINLIEEKDLDRITALSHKYSRELWNLREGELATKYVYNPAYGDKSKQFKTIKVGNTEIIVSLEYLVFELGHHEKEVLYQDKGMKTVHYDEIITTYDSINALVKELKLSQGDADVISSILAHHKTGLDSFMKTRTEYEEAISEMRQEKTIKISEMRKIVEEIQEGESYGERSGLNYLAKVQGDKTTYQMNILNTANLIGGIFVLLAALVIGLYIPYSISKPLANLNRTANEIGKGNLDAKIETKSKDEIGELAASFNKMTQDLRVSRDDIISAKKYTDNIVRSMTDTLLVVSHDGIIQTVNPATCTLLGYKEKELIGEPVSKVVAEGKEIPINFSTFLRQYFLIGSLDNELIKECCIRNVEKTYLAKDGRKIPMLFSGSVMRDDNGNIQGIVCVAQDITERKQAEEALKKLSSAVEHSADSVIITNKDGLIEYVNPAFEKLTGYNKEEAIGNTPDIIKSGKHDKKFYKSLYETIHSGKVFQDELINKKKNCELYHAATTIVPITDAQGTITHFVTTEKYITEHKKAEKNTP